MSSSTTTKFKPFNQQEYINSFVYCDEGHPFVAFTTCYCPICDLQEEIVCLQLEKDGAEIALENTENLYDKLIRKVYQTNPELLL